MTPKLIDQTLELGGGMEGMEGMEKAKGVWSPAMIVAIGLALGLVLVGAGVAYYFVGFLPYKFKTEQVAADTAQKRKDAEVASQQAASDAKADARRQAYQGCLAAADTEYSANWNRNCSSIADDVVVTRNKCIATNPYDNNLRSQCWTQYPDELRADCKLPGYEANNWNKLLADEKARCLDQFRAGL